MTSGRRAGGAFRERPIARRNLSIAPKLLAPNLRAETPNSVWLADISHVPTGDGWLCLAAVKDVATMGFIGPSGVVALETVHWRFRPCKRGPLGKGRCPTGSKAAWQSMGSPRRCRSVARARGLLCHPDRGVKHADADCRGLLDGHRARAWMSGTVKWLDNPAMENFLEPLTMETELVGRIRFPSRRDAEAARFEQTAIFKNRRRRHSSIGYLTPEQAGIDMARPLTTSTRIDQSAIMGQVYSTPPRAS